MAQADNDSKPQFSQPVRQITLMLIALGLACVGAFLALPSVLPIFTANPYLNGVIIIVFFIGVIACFYQVLQLIGSVRWIENFASDAPDPDTIAPQLLAPLASLLRTRGARMQVNATSTRSILDSVSTRIDEAREITRYIVNILIFLGLLGTFYGLATTVPAVVETIRSLAPQEGDGSTDMFARLMTGLESQLGGMGVAFGSSLLGLAGSLVVGLLELFAGHGQNRFYQELEDWLSSITRVVFGRGWDRRPECRWRLVGSHDRTDGYADWSDCRINPKPDSAERPVEHAGHCRRGDDSKSCARRCIKRQSRPDCAGARAHDYRA